MAYACSMDCFDRLTQRALEKGTDFRAGTRGQGSNLSGHHLQAAAGEPWFGAMEGVRRWDTAWKGVCWKPARAGARARAGWVTIRTAASATACSVITTIRARSTAST